MINVLKRNDFQWMFGSRVKSQGSVRLYIVYALLLNVVKIFKTHEFTDKLANLLEFS